MLKLIGTEREKERGGDRFAMQVTEISSSIEARKKCSFVDNLRQWHGTAGQQRNVILSSLLFISSFFFQESNRRQKLSMCRNHNSISLFAMKNASFSLAMRNKMCTRNFTVYRWLEYYLNLNILKKKMKEEKIHFLLKNVFNSQLRPQKILSSNINSRIAKWGKAILSKRFNFIVHNIVYKLLCELNVEV